MTDLKIGDRVRYSASNLGWKNATGTIVHIIPNPDGHVGLIVTDKGQSEFLDRFSHRDRPAKLLIHRCILLIEAPCGNCDGIAQPNDYLCKRCSRLEPSRWLVDHNGQQWCP